MLYNRQRMKVTTQQLRSAVSLVRGATLDFVERGFFKRGVLTRLDQWIESLPNELEELGAAIARKAYPSWGVVLDTTAQQGEPGAASNKLWY
jgi:hypothetical protein